MEENKDRLRMYRMASLKDPDRFAYYIYHIMKKYPECAFCKSYLQSLLYLKDKLMNEYDWSFDDFIRFSKKLSSLSKYKFLTIEKDK